MKDTYLVLMPIVFGVIAGDYVGPQNGFRNGHGNGNGNGNAYGVPTGPVAPTQPQGGPYPPSGWKPNGRRLLLPGESRGAQQPIDSGFGQPPPPQYGPANPVPSGPSIDSQYGPSVDNTAPPNNQYIPGVGFGNGGNGGNGFSNGNGNGHNGNGNGHNGNGNGHNGNGNGHNGNGNGHNGNGNGHNGNGNGHNGNGNGNGNGLGNGNGNGHNGGNGFGTTGNGNGNGNGNGHNGGNGFGATGNGHGNGNGGGGNGNGHNGGNGFSNGNGHNGGNGNGNGNKAGNGANGSNGFAPAFHGAFPGGVIYPFVQNSVPALLAFRPSNGAGHGSIYPIYQVPITPPQSGTDIIVSSLPAGHGVFPPTNAFPSIHNSQGFPDLGTVYPAIQVTGAHDAAGSHSAFIGPGTGLAGNGIGEYHTFLTNHQSLKSNILGVQNGLTNLQLRYPVGQAAYGNAGVPLGIF